MPQAVHSDLFLYADKSGLTFKHEDVHTIEHQLNKDFANFCNWSIDNKLNIHLSEDQTKCILFCWRHPRGAFCLHPPLLILTFVLEQRWCSNLVSNFTNCSRNHKFFQKYQSIQISQFMTSQFTLYGKKSFLLI